MRNRYSAILFSLMLVGAFALGLFIEPSESQANPRSGWKGEYFANHNLAGEPAITAYDDAIEMNWFNTAPYEVLPADYFSVRWTTRLNFQPGIYRFRIGADDAARLFINDILVMDVVSQGTFQTTTRDIRLRGGDYQLRVEYFEEVGLAGVLLDWMFSPQPVEILNFEDQTVELIAPPVVTPPQGYVIVPSAEVYATPYAAEVLSHLHLYQRQSILGLSPDAAWYHVALPAGQTGWVAVQHLRVENGHDLPVLLPTNQNELQLQAQAEAALDLALRAEWHDLNALATIPVGQSLSVLARHPHKPWLYVSWQATPEAELLQGWVFAPFVRLNNEDFKALALK